ncbi:MAG: methionyl-tRNA formyltransferase [Porticoccaceae bacterium]
MTTPPAAPLRLGFAGTPEFAAAHLRALLDSRHPVVAVYTQPDRPAGRGRRLGASPVKELALARGIAIRQPQSLKDPGVQDELAALALDLLVVVAYGLILPPAVLVLPRLGCVNVHASLLPRWRGAAPVQRALAAGDGASGVTIMQMDAGLDTGAILAMRECPIAPGDTGGSLLDRLATLGPPLLLETLDALASGNVRPQPQDNSQATYAAKIGKQEAAIDWHDSAVAIDRKVRAFNPVPVAHARRNQVTLRVWAGAVSAYSGAAAAGTVLTADPDGIVVACGAGAYRILELQLEGRTRQPVAAILNGHADLFAPGTLFD